MVEQQLTQQLECLQSLQSLLQQEFTCLKEKQFNELSSILFNKQELLQQIQHNDNALNKPAIADEIQANTDFLAIKEKIQDLLATCQKDNAVNGRIIELSMKSNKHLMQLIKQASGRNSVTYDQKGMIDSGQLLGKNIKA